MFKKSDVKQAIYCAVAFIGWIIYVKILRVTVDPPVWQYMICSIAWALGALCFAVGPFYSWFAPKEK